MSSVPAVLISNYTAPIKTDGKYSLRLLLLYRVIAFLVDGMRFMRLMDGLENAEDSCAL